MGPLVPKFLYFMQLILIVVLKVIYKHRYRFKIQKYETLYIFYPQSYLLPLSDWLVKSSFLTECHIR